MPISGIVLIWKVKLSAQFLQCIADISSPPRDPLICTTLLITLYSVCFLLLFVEIWIESREVGHERENPEPDGP
jgi:hypothetical protein